MERLRHRLHGWLLGVLLVALIAGLAAARVHHQRRAADDVWLVRVHDWRGVHKCLVPCEGQPDVGQDAVRFRDLAGERRTLPLFQGNTVAVEPCTPLQQACAMPPAPGETPARHGMHTP